MISLYSDNIVSDQTIITGIAKLKVAFPKMSDDFFNLLVEMIIEEQMTEKQLIDSVKHVLKNFQYKELTIANILSYDKKVKLYTYNEVCELVTQGKAEMRDFDLKWINDTPYRIKCSDKL